MGCDVGVVLVAVGALVPRADVIATAVGCDVGVETVAVGALVVRADVIATAVGCDVGEGLVAVRAAACRHRRGDLSCENQPCRVRPDRPRDTGSAEGKRETGEPTAGHDRLDHGVLLQRAPSGEGAFQRVPGAKVVEDLHVELEVPIHQPGHGPNRDVAGDRVPVVEQVPNQDREVEGQRWLVTVRDEGTVHFAGHARNFELDGCQGVRRLDEFLAAVSDGPQKCDPAVDCVLRERLENRLEGHATLPVEIKELAEICRHAAKAGGPDRRKRTSELCSECCNAIARIPGGRRRSPSTTTSNVVGHRKQVNGGTQVTGHYGHFRRFFPRFLSKYTTDA